MNKESESSSADTTLDTKAITWRDAIAEVEDLKTESGFVSNEEAQGYRLAMMRVSSILSRVQEPQGWQPIETAPRDMTDVLLYPDWEVGWFSIAEGGWVLCGWPAMGAELCGHRLAEAPTHWMPLPTPPEADRG